MKNVAVILAGGSGKRMAEGVGNPLPKQFLELGGRTVLEHAVATFERHAGIDEIIVISHPDYLSQTESIIRNAGFGKVKKTGAGGAERYLSVLAALKAYPPSDTLNFVFHDAARPLLSRRVIDRVVDALAAHEAVAVAVPCTDTLFEAEGKIISSIPDRSRFWRAQTPQAFRSDIIREAYRLFLEDLKKDTPDAENGDIFRPTDDCGIVRKYLPHLPVYMVEGEESNIKLTRPQDVPLMENLLKLRDLRG